MTYNYKISKNNKIPLFWLGTFVSVHFFQDWVKIFCQKNKRQRQRHRQSDSKTQHMLYFWNPDDLLIPNMMIDTSPWSSCSCLSPWLGCSGHTFSSTGPSVSPFRDFFLKSLISWGGAGSSFWASSVKAGPGSLWWLGVWWMLPLNNSCHHIISSNPWFTTELMEDPALRPSSE